MTAAATGPCPVCGAAMRHAFTARLLNRHDVGYRHCSACGLLQTGEPYWLEEAYNQAIATSDTGLVARNLALAPRVAALLYLKFNPRSACVDFAGGYGLFTRLMRDLGFNYHWADKYCANLLATGFEAEQAPLPIGAVSAFEVLEHVHDPVAFVQQTLERYACRTLIFSTELYAGDQPPPRDWWYYSFDSGQHISFYQHRTLQALAGRLGLHFVSMGGLHVFTDRKLAPSLWLRLATGRMAPLVAGWARRQLGPLTQRDNASQIQKLRDAAAP